MCAGRACERRKRLFDLRLLLQIYMMRRSRRRAARWTFRKLGASEGERGKEGWREVGAARVPWRAVKELRKTNKKWADEGGGTGAAGWPRCAWSGKRGWRKRSTLFCSLSPSLQALSLSSKPLRDVQFNFGESWNEGRWEGDSAHVESFLSIRCWCAITLLSDPHGPPTSSAPPIDSNLQHSLR